MIPKKIHYCWYGTKEPSRSVQFCMDTWKRYCPDYEIVRWDASNSPLEDNLYVRQAYAQRKWAFVSDYVRLRALEEQGGVYLDTDVELCGPLDAFLNHEAFLGFESMQKVGTCLIGAVARASLLQDCLREYDSIPFLLPNGKCDCTTNVERITALLLSRGLTPDNRMQAVAGAVIYPSEYFSPIDLSTGKLTRTPHTHAIHHFSASWMTPRQRFHTRVAQWIGPTWTERIKRMRNR